MRQLNKYDHHIIHQKTRERKSRTDRAKHVEITITFSYDVNQLWRYYFYKCEGSAAMSITACLSVLPSSKAKDTKQSNLPQPLRVMMRLRRCYEVAIANWIVKYGRVNRVGSPYWQNKIKSLAEFWMKGLLDTPLMCLAVPDVDVSSLRDRIHKRQNTSRSSWL